MITCILGSLLHKTNTEFALGEPTGDLGGAESSLTAPSGMAPALCPTLAQGSALSRHSSKPGCPLSELGS